MTGKGTVAIAAAAAASIGAAAILWALVLSAPAPEPPQVVLIVPTLEPDAPAAPPPVYAAEMTDSGARRFFDHVATQVAATGSMDGGAYAAAFVAAGVPGELVEASESVTTDGYAAETVQFSVRWADRCVIGDVGHGTYTSQVEPAFHWGTCLAGNTRPRTW
ncbi:DUF6993 domain-containing protein [Agromyces humi]|uniref:DUF6993 domain-containing protein n=1 Tax=Agromyces humi TaxID=1766800 RepID=UPI00135CD3B2|nr:hypothetical protein [Agromyces humi]